MTGYAAIQPYLDTIPAFTEEDVKQYMTTHPICYGDITPVGESKLAPILYTTREEVAAMLAMVLDASQNTVFYAELLGTFQFFGGPAPGRRITFHTLFAVFDAQTGNLVAEGGRP
jgi:hypothetical protein